MTGSLENARPTYPDSLAALPLSKLIHYVYGVAETLLVRPAGMKTLVVAVESGSFRVKPGNYVAKTFADGNVTVGSDTIGITNHGFETGDGPYQLTTTGVVPAGLALLTDYWLVKIDANTIKLAASLVNALKETPVVVDITAAAGGGTHTIGGVPSAPASTQAVGLGSFKLVPNSGDPRPLTISAPSKLTVKGSGATDALAYWWLP